MELTLANRRRTSVGFKRNIEFSRSSTNEAMSVFKVEPVRSTGKLRWEKKRSTPLRTR